MIDTDKLAAGIAADLMRTGAYRTGNLEYVIREAFRRGFQIGEAMRTPAQFCRRHPNASASEDQRWTAKH